jgi:hypothetical protein
VGQNFGNSSVQLVPFQIQVSSKKPPGSRPVGSPPAITMPAVPVQSQAMESRVSGRWNGECICIVLQAAPFQIQVVLERAGEGARGLSPGSTEH